MTYYSVCTQPELPDDRLSRQHVTPAGVVTEYREGHISPHLVRDLDELFRHVSYSSAFAFNPEPAPGAQPDWELQYEAVDSVHLPLCTFAFARSQLGGRDFYTVQVRSDMISSALLREINDHLIPESAGLVSYTEAPRQGARGTATSPLLSSEQE